MSDPVYFQYHIITEGGGDACQQGAVNAILYDFVASADFNGDGTFDNYAMYAGPNAQWTLTRSPGIVHIRGTNGQNTP